MVSNRPSISTTTTFGSLPPSSTVVDPNSPVLATEEGKRLIEHERQFRHWKKWGPYVSERQWATVREDYSINGDAWRDFPFEHSSSRAYRWGEDGIAGISDNHQKLCFSTSFWNTKDSRLKERLYGLTNHQGNHGEDVKEMYYYLDNTPTHSYMKYLYKYPQNAFPYEQLVQGNAGRSRNDLEYEIEDTGIFENNRYFDIFIEYAKFDDKDLAIRITIHNRNENESASICVIPTLWFRNTWSWGIPEEAQLAQNLKSPCIDDNELPSICRKIGPDNTDSNIVLEALCGRDRYFLYADKRNGNGLPLFTENETNYQKLFGIPNKSQYTKDAFEEFLISQKVDSVNPKQKGTKAGILYGEHKVEPGGTLVLSFRLKSCEKDLVVDTQFGASFDDLFKTRISEANEFYQALTPKLTDDVANIQRQAFAGMLWSKQYYHFIVKEWLEGDPLQPKPPCERKRLSKNKEWIHMYAEDILSMPDKWEYPFFAAWDTAFQSVVLSLVDPDFAKRQLLTLTREWYMHPNGQIPAYEWNFNDVNPPVLAWAAYRIFKLERRVFGRQDFLFLERVFQKLLLNFTWWVNRKDSEGLNVFEGGFLGLDNIGVFNRSEEMPMGGRLRQADATGWMAMFCLNMLDIGLELAQRNPAYEDIASKFFEHFLYISDAMSHVLPNGQSVSLWSESDGFYYDILVKRNNDAESSDHITIRSLVGLIPLFASLVLEPEKLNKVPDFKRRMAWFVRNRWDLTGRNIASIQEDGMEKRRLLALCSIERLIRILKRLLCDDEFLSPFGFRSLSKYHEAHPYVYWIEGREHRVDYEANESRSGMFGGNSNWRGSLWMPVNFLLVEALQRFHYFLGESLKFPFPYKKGQPYEMNGVLIHDADGVKDQGPAGKMYSLMEISDFINQRLLGLFTKSPECNGRRPIYTENAAKVHGPRNVLFYEYFNGDTGRGLGASHQTGWTGLIANIICRLYRS